MVLLVICLSLGCAADQTQWPEAGANGQRTNQGLGDWSHFPPNGNANIAWSFATNLTGLNSPVVGADGSIYLMSPESNGTLIALSSTGKLKWSVTHLGYDEGFLQPLVAPNNLIYVVNSNWELFGFDGDNGTAAIQSYLLADGYRNAAPSLSLTSNSSSIVVFDLEQVLFVDPTTGATTVVYPIQEYYTVSPLPTMGPDGIIYFCASASEIYAMAPGGDINWQTYSNCGFTTVPFSVGPSNTLFYLGRAYHTLDAADAVSGDPLWSSGLSAPLLSLAVSSQNTVFAFGNDITALNGATGDKLWVKSLTSCTPSSSLVLGSAGTLFFTCGSTVYAVSPSSGVTLWSYPIESSSSFSANLVITANGSLIVASSSGVVYALQGASSN